MHLLVATPIEADLADRIRSAAAGVTVAFEPDLLPDPRYPSDHKGDPSFRRSKAQEARFARLLAEADAIFGVPGENPDSLAHVVRTNPRLTWVQGTSAGIGEMVRLARLTQQEMSRVVVTSASGIHGTQLAEWALLGLLAFTKDIPRLLADQKERRWERYAVRELYGQTLLVVGLGAIGRAVAERASAMGMRVLAVRRSVGAGIDRCGARGSGVAELHSVDDLPDLIPLADAVVLALPGTPETAGLLNRDMIRRLRSNAIIINVGRGTTIDESALIEALEERRIAGAALDVYPTEPLPKESHLWTLPNVLLSPHTASVSVNETARIVDLLCENIRRRTNGERLINVVDVEHYY